MSDPMSLSSDEDFGTSTGDPRDVGEQYLDALKRGDEAALYRLAETHPDHRDLFMEIRSTRFLAKLAE